MSKLDSATERFKAALDRLEASVHRQLQRAQAAGPLEAQIAALREDRSRLAEELDATKADTRHLTELNEKASETLANAIDGIREIIAEHQA